MPLHWKIKNKSKAPKTDKQKRVRALDEVFSLFIRLRDCDTNGIVKCITCGSFHHYTEVDCGHFITRENMGTRWEEENCNGQCQKCNRFQSGKQYQHGKAIDKKFGAGTADKLTVKGNSVCHWQDFEIEAMITYYRAAVKELKAERGMV